MHNQDTKKQNNIIANPGEKPTPVLDPKLRRLFPKQKQALPDKAEHAQLITLFNETEFERCKALATQLLKQFPSNGLYWKILGAAEQNVSNNEAAIAALHQAKSLIPNDADVLYNLGNAQFDLLQLTEAISSYKNAIAIEPENQKAWFNLGSTYEAGEQYDLAEQAFRKAIEIDQNTIQPHLKLVGLLDRLDRVDEAIDCLNKVTNTNHESSELYLTLAIELGKNGQVQQANAAYEKAISIAPDDINLYNNYGLYLQQHKAFQKAEQIYLTGFRSADANPEILCSIGMLYYELGRIDQAEHCFKQALVSFPDSAIAFANFALYLYNQGHIYDAVKYGLKALEIEPDNIVALNNLGLAYQACNHFEDSVEQFEKVIALAPNNIPALSNISLPLKRLGRLSQAEDYVKQGLAINSEAHDLVINLASIYQGKGQIVEAAELNQKAIEIAPERLMSYHNLLFDMCYSNAFDRDEIMAQLKRYGKMATQVATLQFDQWRARKTGEKLRVGFVSADFLLHPVTSFLTTVLKNFDQQQFELYAYSNNAKEDYVTQKIKPYFFAWELIVGRSDEEVARQIHADGIDILIDLSGHTGGTRLPMFAYKPAPVQVTWLGYWASTGIEQMDYILLDEVSAPVETADQFTEQPHYLPVSRFCYSPPTEEVALTPLPALQNGYVTLGCYHNYSKVTDEVLSLWATCLAKQSDLQLRWITSVFKDDKIVAQMHAKFSQLGIDQSRVSLIGSLPRQEYLESFAQIDLMIDAFPFTSCTTASDGLWMGVPTLAMAGNALVSRQSTSLMHAVDLPDWVAHDEAEYVQKIIRFANDLPQLADIRASLRDRIMASPFGDAKQFTRNLETALTRIWHDYEQQPENAFKQNTLIETVNGDSVAKHVIVSATRSTKADFWAQTALGISLKKLEKQGFHFSHHIATDNTEGLPTIYNRLIEAAPDDCYLTLIHDDVWIDDNTFFETLDDAVNVYDVVGLAGNKRLAPKQANWLFINPNQMDQEAYLSGQTACGKEPHGLINYYGDSQQACETLDGVMLTVSALRLKQAEVRFDEQFKFHFYDMDFCRSARLAGLELGTWVLNVTHQSAGGYNSAWYEVYKQYLAKWEPNAIPEPFDNVNEAFSDSIKEVLGIAKAHSEAGRYEQALSLYEEVIAVMPDQSEALYLAAEIVLQTGSCDTAQGYLEKAVKNSPDQLEYRTLFVEVLIRNEVWGNAKDQLNMAKRKGLSETVYQGLMQRIMDMQP